MQQRIRRLGNPERGRGAARFFKSGPGEYGEGDVFLGLNAAEVRGLAKEFRGLPLAELKPLLESEFHDDRSVALLIVVEQATKADRPALKKLYEFYLAQTHRINNWDLVDCSARDVVGAYLHGRSRKPLEKLARSKSLWERRIAIVATHYSIREGEFKTTLAIAEMLLSDEEDLIHKAVGWMLREVGKRDQDTLEEFLDVHAAKMPRTSLRYAIERFPDKLRRAYMKR